jgi:hypothetical protein
VWVGAALTKPGRVSTARWCGSGERDGEEYGQEPVSTSLKGLPAQNLADMGRVRCAPADQVEGLIGGELLGGLVDVCREATVKCCGLAVAMPQGHNWAPPSSSEQQ